MTALMILILEVNASVKDLRLKAKAKDLTTEAKAKSEDFSFKAKVKARVSLRCLEAKDMGSRTPTLVKDYSSSSAFYSYY